jgi:O-antigen ligase
VIAQLSEQKKRDFILLFWQKKRDLLLLFLHQPMDIPRFSSRSKATLLVVVSMWPLLILANTIPAFEESYRIIGYHWKVEFFIGLFLFIAVAYLSIRRDRTVAPDIRTPGITIVLPFVLFVIWSGFSTVWAVSWRNALHHTLLWGCYLIFFLLLYNLLRIRTFLPISLLVIGVVVLAVSGSCLTEYLGNSGIVTWDYTYRYYRFAEALGLFIPIFFALSYTQKGRVALFCMLVGLSGSLLVLLSLSRTSLISLIIGLAVFFGFGFGLKKLKAPRHKLYASFCLLLALVAITQSLNLVGGKNTTVSRIADATVESQTSANARYLFWGIAIEAFEASPLIGVGADDYISVYELGRERYAQRDPSNPINEINENVIPERAHSEYLQILSELGIVGIGLFGAFLFGVFRLVIVAKTAPVSLLTLGALSGTLIFLISSAASSYSFREPANGLAFFFVLAVSIVSLEKSCQRNKSNRSLISSSYILKRHLLATCLVVSVLTITFSAIRGLSEFHLAHALNSGDNFIAVEDLKKAIDIDRSDPTFRYYYATGLFLTGDAKDAIPEFRFAIDRGIAISNAYYNLASAQTMVGQRSDAEATYIEALRVYPRSVFLQTAYASFLKESGQALKAEEKFKSALAINAIQARSWQLAHDEGLEQLAKISRVDSGYVSTFDLKPDSAPLVVANAQNKRAHD